MMSSSAAGSSELADTIDSEAAGSSHASPDNLFSEFRKLCQQLEVEPGYNAKTKIVADFIKHGSSGGHFSLSHSLFSLHPSLLFSLSYHLSLSLSLSLHRWVHSSLSYHLSLSLSP